MLLNEQKGQSLYYTVDRHHKMEYILRQIFDGLLTKKETDIGAEQIGRGFSAVLWIRNDFLILFH
jgi:hypothetical protein